MSRVAHPAGPRHADVLPAEHPPAPPQDLNALYPEIWPGSARRAGGVLTVGGLDVRDLAAEFGTPLFVCDEADFRQRCRGYREAFGAQAGVFYAAKAFCCRGVLRWVTEEGLGVDVCTGGELEVALQAGVPPEMITFHGSNKLESELARALDAGVGHIVVDSFEEIARLAYLTDPPVPGRGARVPDRATANGNANGRRDRRRDRRAWRRVPAPGAGPGHHRSRGAHPRVRGHRSRRPEVRFLAVLRRSRRGGAPGAGLPGVELAGLHSHIGSQIFDTDGFEAAARRVLGLAVRIRDEHGIVISELNLGGGLGIAYTPDDDPADVKVIAQNLHEIVRGQCAAAGLVMPRLTVEPGRAIAGPGTVTLYEVGTVKDVDGLRTYVSVDGGMSDNIRTALYDAEYTCVLASRESAAEPMLSRIVGRHCESGDIVVRDSYLPSDLVPGDLLAVAATGAYCRSMASNYNHVARPAVVAVRDGAARLLLRRETIDDLLRLDAG